jgi:hypothetical protein
MPRPASLEPKTALVPEPRLDAEVRSTETREHAEGAAKLTRTSVSSGNFKYSRKGRRIKLYLIRCPFPFTRSTRSALQSEGYGHQVDTWALNS